MTQTAWIVAIAVAASGGCPDDDDSSPPVIETPTPESATLEATPAPFRGDLSTDEYLEMVGFQYGDPSGELTGVDTEVALLRRAGAP